MSSVKADEIWSGGDIRTLEAGNPRVAAMAVRDGRILALGSEADVANLEGPGTRRHRLHGRQVLPGFVESHVHALWGACRELFDVHVPHQATLEQLLDAVRARTGEASPEELVVGGSWRLDMRAAMGADPRALLDRVAPDHAVVLQDLTQHSLWCNSRALARASMDTSSPDVPGGVVERDPATGAPNGILAENACRPVKALMRRTPEQLRRAARHFVRHFNGMGLTAFKEPMAFEEDLAAYRAADRRGELTLHAAAHLVRSSPFGDEDTPWDTLERWRRDYASENLRTGFAKLFLDGVAPSFTASFIEPYVNDGVPRLPHDPLETLLIEPARLERTLIELDRRRFVTKMHCVGDRAVRAALDAIAAARTANGASGLSHEIAHCPFVDDADLPRFAALDAVVEASPKLWFPNAMTAAQIAVLGHERVQRCHRLRDLLEAGATITYASDWPAASPDANPWTGLAGMLDRRDATGRYPGVLGDGQQLTLDQALPLFTVNGARSLGMAAESGTLAIGKWADFIVVEHPLHTLAAPEIGAVDVAETHWKGRCVHAR